MNSAKIPANPPPSNFPSDVLRWMKKNSPSPGMSLKLMKICKYFQLTDLTDFKAHVPVKGVYTVKRSDHLWYETIRHKNKRVVSVKDLPNRLWITEYLNFNEDFSLAELIPKIGFCEAKQFYFINQNILFNEFKILNCGKCVTYLKMKNTTLKYNDRKDVSFEDFIQLLPVINSLNLRDIVPSIKSLKAANELTPKTLEKVEIYDFQTNFSLSSFFKYMDNHQHIEFKLVHYKTYNIEDVQQYVDKLIKKDVPDYPAPIIYFPGQKKNLSLIRKKYCKFNMP